MKVLYMGIVVAFIFMMGCKKEEKLQPTWWDRIWVKEYYVMGKLNEKHVNVILPKIEEIRKTTQEYVTWDDDLIQTNGPGGYTPTANKAWRVWLETYQSVFMPDTTVMPHEGELVDIIENYLENRREHDKDKSFTKLHLCVPKELYEQDSRIWEWWLSKMQYYLTVTLGGPMDWTDGTRQLWQEIEIYNLPTTPDPDDPWHSECSAEIRITLWYKAYAEGPKDKSVQWDKLDVATKISMTNEMVREQYPNYEKEMQTLKKTHGQFRYENLLNVPEEGFPLGNPQDYETKQGIVNGMEVYYIEIPCIQTQE